MSAMIEVRGVSKAYRQLKALDNVTFQGRRPAASSG